MPGRDCGWGVGCPYINPPAVCDAALLCSLLFLPIVNSLSLSLSRSALKSSNLHILFPASLLQLQLLQCRPHSTQSSPCTTSAGSFSQRRNSSSTTLRSSLQPIGSEGCAFRGGSSTSTSTSTSKPCPPCKTANRESEREREARPIGADGWASR